MRLKVMTYNIWRGFHTFDQQFQPQRLDAARRVVAKEQPDLLALTEAWHHDKINYRKLFHFPYSHIGVYPSEREPQVQAGNALLSRYPLEARILDLPPKSVIRGYARGEGKTLCIDVMHASIKATEQEKIRTLQPLFPIPSENYILTGDFNALSPEDQWYDRGKLLEEVSQEGVHLPHPDKFIDELLKREFVKWILQQGVRDAFEKKEKRLSTVPTNVKYGRPVDGMRVDYFFVSPHITVEDAYVVKNEDAEQASDHYPIVGIFQLE